jgi:hypothetical protein
MPVLSCTYESLQLLLEEIGLALSNHQPPVGMADDCSVGENMSVSIPSGGKTTRR